MNKSPKLAQFSMLIIHNFLIKRFLPDHHPVEHGHDGLEDDADHGELGLCCLLHHVDMSDCFPLKLSQNLHDERSGQSSCILHQLGQSWLFISLYFNLQFNFQINI